ncbi:MAG: hypothetical protein ACXWP5_13590 [Bdellovibrionota bacterium]
MLKKMFYLGTTLGMIVSSVSVLSPAARADEERDSGKFLVHCRFHSGAGKKADRTCVAEANLCSFNACHPIPSPEEGIPGAHQEPGSQQGGQQQPLPLPPPPPPIKPCVDKLELRCDGERFFAGPVDHDARDGFELLSGGEMTIKYPSRHSDNDEDFVVTSWLKLDGRLGDEVIPGYCEFREAHPFDVH